MVVALAIGACGLAYGLTFNTVAIVAFGFCVNALIQTFAALLYAYTPELYPTHLRNTGNGLVYGLGRLSNIAGPLIVAALFGAYGYQTVFGYIAVCWVIVAGTIGFFGPRTGMRRLEQLNGSDGEPDENSGRQQADGEVPAPSTAGPGAAVSR